MIHISGPQSRGRWKVAPVGIFRSSLSATAILAMIGVGALGSTAAVGAAPSPQVTERDSPTELATPEDSLAYLVFELDEESDQWAQAQTLIENAGFGNALSEARDDMLTDAAGNNLPLDAILGGEGAIVVSGAAIEAVVNASSGMTAAIDGEGSGTPAAEVDGVPTATGAAFLLDARAPDTAFAAIQTAVQDQADESGGEVIEVDYEGVTIEYVGATDDGPNDGMAVARVDDLIVVAASPTDIEPIIDTAQGGPAIADFAPYATIRDELPDDALLFGFFNGVAAADAQASLTDLGVPANLTGAGTYTGLQILADDPGFRMETVTSAADGAELPVATENFESELATFVPGDVLFFLSGGELGQTGILDAFGAGLIALGSGFTGGSATTPTADETPEDFIAAQYEQAEGLIGFNLQTDLFQQFVGEFGLYVRSEADPTTISSLFVTDVEDPGTVVNALSQLTILIQGAGLPITTRQVNGSDVSVIDTGDPSLPDVTYGVVDDQFLFGVGTAVDDYSEGPVDVLADNEQYQAVMGTLPADTNGSLYVDLAQIIPLLQALDTASADASGDEFGIEDADPSCDTFPTQAEAQTAYEAGEPDTFNLDQDFDGEVCEDFFVSATPIPAPAETEATTVDLSALRAFGLVAYEEGGMQHSSSILYIEPAE